MIETPKYKIGDKVRLIEDESPSFAGDTGVVQEVDGSPFVLMDIYRDGLHHDGTLCVGQKNLELIPEQLTSKICKDNMVEHMATDEDMAGLEELVKAARPLPEDAAERKTYPIYSGFMAYFPHAIAAVAHLSYLGNLQHHPDKPLHWDMSKSSDELDAMMRHTIDGITAITKEQVIDEAKRKAWRAMADLERKLTGKCTYDTKTIIR